jgi:hypothetical protein
MATLGEIDTMAKEFSDARQRLKDTMQDLEDRQETVLRQFLPGIKRQVSIVEEKEEALKAAIGDSPKLFGKPRTVIMHGVRCGFRKGNGKLEWEDDDQVVKLIKKHHADMVDLLVRTREKPVESALKQLDAADLMKLGVTVEGTGDVVVAQPTDSRIEKQVKKLLQEDRKKAQGDKEIAAQA